MIKRGSWFGICLLVSAVVANGLAVLDGPAASADDILVIDDAYLRQDFKKKVQALLNGEPSLFITNRVEQLQRRSCKLELPATGSSKMTPADIYRERINSVLMVGVFYKCSSKKCRRLHSSISTGVLIHEDGVLLSNYHVVDFKQRRVQAMAVMTWDGKVFLVKEVLAADPTNDAVILKLEGTRDMPAAPVFRDEPVGNPVTLITHPKGNFYSLTSGYVSRYTMGKKENVVMSVTADYALGSSGGPIFNDRGDVVGLVSSTTSIAAGAIHINMGNAKHVSAVGSNEVFWCAENAVKPTDAAEEYDEPDSADQDEHEHGDESPIREETVEGRSIKIPINHQMTLKNAVPARAILDLISE